MSSSDLPKLSKTSVKPVHYIDSIYVLALQSSLIMLIALTMTWFSEKNTYESTRCQYGFMPNLHKKSWMVSKLEATTPYYYLCLLFYNGYKLGGANKNVFAFI